MAAISFTSFAAGPMLRCTGEYVKGRTACLASLLLNTITLLDHLVAMSSNDRTRLLSKAHSRERASKMSVLSGRDADAPAKDPEHASDEPRRLGSSSGLSAWLRWPGMSTQDRWSRKHRDSYLLEPLFTPKSCQSLDSDRLNSTSIPRPILPFIRNVHRHSGPLRRGHWLLSLMLTVR